MTTTELKIPRKAERFIQIGAAREAVNEESRTIELSFSSDAPVRMSTWDGEFDEILEHGESNIRMGRLMSSAPLLYNHNRDNLIGVVTGSRVKDGKGYATVKFSRDEDGEKRFQQVRDGVLVNVSVGYMRHRVEPEGRRDNGVETVRVTDWEPLEVSLVTVPADVSVGVGRKADDSEGFIVVKRNQEPTTKEAQIMSEENKTPSVNVDEVRAEAQRAERKRISEIDALTKACLDKNIDIREESDKAKAEGWKADQLRSLAFEKLPGVTPAKPVELPKDTSRKYSVARALNLLRKGKLDGFEAEVSQELALQTKRDDGGLYIPIECLGMRTMTAGSATAGGYSVAEDLMADMFIEKLDNKPRVAEAGAVEINGLVGDVAVPRQTGGATAYWLGETEENTSSELALGIKRAVPHRLAVDIPWSYQLESQSSLALEQLVRMDAQKRINLAKDLAALRGTGASQPMGIFNDDDVQTGTFGAAATFAKIIEFESKLATENAEDLGAAAWFVDPTSYAKWAAKSKDTGSGQFLWTGGLQNGNVNGLRGYISNHLASNKAVLGIWNQLLMLTWQGVRVIVDETTNKKSGIVEIHMEVMCDTIVRQPKAFVISTDSAAQ